MIPPTVVRPSGRFGLLVSLAFLTPFARADRIELRGGGQVKGKVLGDAGAPGMVSVLLERGKAPVRFRKEQLLRVTAEPGPLDDYLPRRAAAGADAESQYALGLWCEGAKLTDLAQAHYQAAVAADKGFAPARRKLGHVAWGDRWLVGDEIKEAQGLVKHKGRWVTAAEKEAREQSGALEKDRAAWARRLRGLREAMATGADDRRREAESQLLALKDPAAVVPLVRVFGGDDPPFRKVLARALGNVPGKEAAVALVNGLVNEGDADVRHTWLDEVGRRDEPEAAEQLRKALRSNEPDYVNRAAWAVAHMDLREAVPALVGALTSTKQDIVWAAPNGGPADAGQGIAAAFGSAPAAVPVQPGAPVAYNGSSVAYLNGPAVGPGVVAYGATSVPLYPANPTASPDLGNPGLAASGANFSVGGGLAGSRGPVPAVVTYTIDNAEVLAALVKLTGQDFGFDRDAWGRWVADSFKPEPAPVRRVPQP